jgi:hypothetical protein
MLVWRLRDGLVPVRHSAAPTDPRAFPITESGQGRPRGLPGQDELGSLVAAPNCRQLTGTPCVDGVRSRACEPEHGVVSPLLPALGILSGEERIPALDAVDHDAAGRADAQAASRLRADEDRRKQEDDHHARSVASVTIHDSVSMFSRRRWSLGPPPHRASARARRAPRPG